MVKNNPMRNTAVFYTCGTCNLNCRYCNIDKNPMLHEIDKELAKSFEGDYYFNRVKEYFPDRTMLRTIDTWGGEPFIHMERIYPLLRKLIEEYPYFENMFSSTNFSFDTWVDQFFGLMDIFGEYPHRYFKYSLQLSIDGPEAINDENRGKGVTKRCLANFHKMVELLKDGRLPPNVKLDIGMKGTLDLDNIRTLQDKQSIIDYFKFYEDNYIMPIYELNNPNVFMNHSVPNTAVPSPVTKADGKLFANLCRLTRQIEQENQTERYFKFYTCITPFSTGWSCPNCANYSQAIYGCGSGTSVIGFLPNNIVTSCHEGFIEIVEQYNKLAKNRNLDNIVISFNRFLDERKIQLTMTDEQFAEHERKMMTYVKPEATSGLATATTEIMALALAKQIDEKYLDEYVARNAASYFLTSCAFCIKDNYNQTGSFTMQHVGLYKLLLNGALDYITQGGNNCLC